jgi:predicted nucleic acid-binding protein
MTAGERLIDTNVLVHAYVLLNVRKQIAAREIVMPIWQEGNGLTTLQNLCEFFTVSTKKIERPMPVEQAESIVREILGSEKWRVLDRQKDTVLRTIELVKLHRVPFWDALIAACMLEHGVRTIVTENVRDFKRIPGVTVVNPFTKTQPS